jgi:hypothetical protein
LDEPVAINYTLSGSGELKSAVYLNRADTLEKWLQSRPTAWSRGTIYPKCKDYIFR